MKFDADKFKAEVSKGFAAVVDEFDDTLLKPKMKEIAASWVSRRAGRANDAPDWGPEVAAMIEEYVKDDTLNSIHREVGIKEDDGDSAAVMRARVTALGSGYNSINGGGPIMTKPGSMVWNNALTGKIMSTAKYVHRVPDTWNDIGNDFVREATDQLRQEFYGMIESRKDEIVQKAFIASFSM